MTRTPLLALALLACSSDPDTTDSDPTTPSMVTVTIEHVGTTYDFVDSGSFDTPVGSMDAGPAGPGAGYSFTVHAGPGQRLSFATMFAQSNDLFLAPDPEGIELWPGGTALSGDVTAQISYWDAGTELDEEPGAGDDQAPRQGAAGQGPADTDSTVRVANGAWPNLPAVADLLSVTVTHQGDDLFEIAIDNISAPGGLSTSLGAMDAPITPGVWAVHDGGTPLFSDGTGASPELEALAEDGDSMPLVADVADRTGLTTPLAPAAWAVHTGPSPLFVSGETAPAGLEALAEDGDPSALAEALAGPGGVLDTAEGASGPGPLMAGERWVLSVDVLPGEELSLATMIVQSNDLFVGGTLDPTQMGDQTDRLMLWDAGTEVNQHPGTGPDQAPRQAGPDTGADEMGTVGPVADMFSYPAVDALVRVTVTPG